MNKPIGIFDSGVGGTSIWKEINDSLPNESTLYLSDSSNAPYGNKSKKEIIELSIKNTEYLLKANAKLIVVACNTATTNAIAYLRANYDVPFVGIEPAIKPAAIASNTKRVGILATKGTLNSDLFAKTSSQFNQITFVEQVGTGLVEAVERGDLDSDILEQTLKNYLYPMMEQQIDQLVLGCTHYPYLKPLIEKTIGNKIPIIDSGFAVAKQTKSIIEKHHLSASVNHSVYHNFFTNGNEEVLRFLLRDYSNIEVFSKDF